MKKILLSSAVILGAVAFGANTANATSEDTKKTGSVELTTVDPSEALKITEASSLDFGSKQITTGDLNFTEDNAPKLTVQDIRGAANGWNVQVALGEFEQTNAANGVTPLTLKGVKMFYPAPVFTTVETAINTDAAPSGIQNSTDVSFTKPAVTGVMLNSSATPSSKVLINASEGKGNGLWTATYGADTSDKIELQVPAGNSAGQYEAELTYTLVDAPAS